LEDGCGDGYSLDIASSDPRVFYDMLEDPSQSPGDFGTLREFIGFITEVHSSGLASVDENDCVVFDLAEYDKIESDYRARQASR
jgi:hypothetical protein